MLPITDSQNQSLGYTPYANGSGSTSPTTGGASPVPQDGYGAATPEAPSGMYAITPVDVSPSAPTNQPGIDNALGTAGAATPGGFDFASFLAALSAFLGGNASQSASNGNLQTVAVPIQTSTGGGFTMPKWIWFLVIGGAAFYAYKKGWFSKLTGAAASATGA